MPDADTITAVATLVAALTGMVTAVGMVLTRRDVRGVQQEVQVVGAEVRTSNALTMGQASDAAESRRVEAIPAGDRTDAERDHLSSTGTPPVELA